MIPRAPDPDHAYCWRCGAWLPDGQRGSGSGYGDGYGDGYEQVGGGDGIGGGLGWKGKSGDSRNDAADSPASFMSPPVCADPLACACRVASAIQPKV